MAHKTAIALDFQALNLDNIINALKGINTLTGKIELPKNVINQINDLTTAVEAMKASTATLGKTKLDSKEFKEFSKNITQSFNELDQRVTLLEQAMVKIGQKQDVSGIVKSLTEIKNNANDATVAIKNMNEIIATPKTLSKNQISLKSLKEELEILKEIKGLQDQDSIEGTISSSKISKMNSKSIIKSLREQIETVQELQMDLDELRESNSSNIEIRAKADQIVSIIATIDRLQERYEKLNGELSLQDIDLYPEIKGGSNIGDIIVEIEDSFSEFNKAISKQIDDITSKINSLPKTINKTKQEIKESAKDTTSIAENFDISNTKYSKQNKKQITIPLHIQAGASETLRKEIDTILDSIQEDIKPLEVRVALVSGYKTKKNEELASQLQENLASIDDKKIKDKLSGLIDTLKKQFETKLHLDIEVEGGERASKIVKDTIKGLQDDLMGGLPPIDVDAQFNEKTLLKLKRQLATIKFQPIKIDVSKDGETTKKEVTPIAALKTLIDRVKKAVNEKSSAFEEEAKIVNESVTFELQRLQKLYEALMTIYRTLDKIDNSFDLASVATDEFVTRGLIRLQRFYEAIVTIKRNLEDISKISLNFDGIKIGIDKKELNNLFNTLDVNVLLTELENKNIQINLDTKSANKKIDNLVKKIKGLEDTVKINIDTNSENNKESFSTNLETSFVQNIKEETKETKNQSNLLSASLEDVLSIYQKIDSEIVEVTKSFDALLERGFVWNSITGEHTDLNKTGEHGSIKAGEIYRSAKFKPDSAIHTHPENHVAMSIVKPSNRYEGDLAAFAVEYQNGIKTQIIRSLKETLVFDADQFFSDIKKASPIASSDNFDQIIQAINQLEKEKGFQYYFKPEILKNIKISKESYINFLNEILKNADFLVKTFGEDNGGADEYLISKMKQKISDDNITSDSLMGILKKSFDHEAFDQLYSKNGANNIASQLLKSLYAYLYNGIIDTGIDKGFWDQLEPLLKEKQQQVEEEAFNAIISNYVKDKSYSDYVKRYDNTTFDSKIWSKFIPNNNKLSGDDAIVQYINDLEKVEIQSEESKNALKEVIDETKRLEQAGSSIELLNNLNEEIQLAKELENTFLDVSEAEEKMVLSGDRGDSAGFLSPEDMQKELAIAEKLSKEEQETNQYINKSQDELQQCLQSEERWLAKCKEGSKAYERRKKNIEEINALLHSSKSSTENVDTKAEESSEGLEKESNKLSDIYEEAQKAATAKEEFAKANAEVLQSIKDSLKELDEESNAFKNLNTLLKLINSLSGKGSDTKIEKLAENLNNISKAFKSLNIKDSKILTQIDNLLQKGDELKVLSDILKNNQKAISAAEKAVSKSQTEDKNKKEAASYLTSYRDEIEKNWKEMVDSNQWTVLSQQIEPFKDGLIHITALVKELDGTYKELTYTTETGEIFDLQKSKEDAVAIQKKADAYERYQQIIANTIEGAQNIGEITEISPDNEAWQKLVELMQRFGIEAKDAVKIIRQVDEVGHESFQVFDSLGNKKTIGVSSKDFLAIKTTVKDVNNEFDKLEKGLESLRNLSGKSFDYTNEEAGKLKNTFIQIADAIKNIQETPLNSEMSTKYLKDVERYQNILDDFDKNWFKENKLKTTNPQIVQQYRELKDELSSIINQMKSEDFDFPSQSSIDRMDKFSQKARDFYSEIEAGNQKMTSANVVEKFAGKIADTLTKNSAMSKELREQFEALGKQVKETAAQFDGMLPVDKFNEFTLAFQKLDTEMKRTGQTGLSFWDLVGRKIKGISASLIAQYFSLMDVVRYVRQAATTIHELDTALVDLKKTTTMNNADLEEFYKNSSNIAKQMGVTTAEIINQASAWSRLGFSSKEESETMAQLSSQFASISPGMGTDEAQTGLVSLIKAWDIDVKNVERELMDNINTLGNKFALTNKDIIEGMERAGATLSVIGTSVQDSFALFTGAQEVIQNAESVGTALKTLSLRIRGYDEETEELSDDVIAATGKVADLTKVASNNFAGVSLWADAAQTQYRSLKDYLGDIAKIWDEIDAGSQTKLLENLFGKRGASVGSSILQNFDQVERALDEMKEATGAADAEMEIIRESWDYKLNALKETWTGIFQSLIDRGTIGDLIDLLTSLSEAINAVVNSSAGLPAIIGTITGLITTIRGQGVLDKSSILRNNDGTIGGINLWGLGNIGTRDARAGVGAFSQAEVNIVQQLGAALENTTDNGKAYNDLMMKLTPNTRKYVNEQLAAGKATDEVAIAMSAGTVKANAMTIATKALNFALSTLGVFAATWAIGKILQGLDYLIHYEEKVKEKANDARNAISQLTENLNKNTSVVNSSKERYAELAQSVGNLGTVFQNQGTLSTDEYKEFLDISNELSDLYPELTKGYDENGNAILDLSGNVNTIVSSLDELIDRENVLARKQINEEMPAIWQANTTAIKKSSDELDEYKDQLKSYNDIIDLIDSKATFTQSEETWGNILGLMDDLKSSIDTNKLFDKYDETTQSYVSSFSLFNDEEIALIKRQAKKYVKEVTTSIIKTQHEIEQVNTEMQSQLRSWMSTDVAFAKLDETQKSMVYNIISNFDMSNLPTNVTDWASLTDFYENIIINSIDKINNTEISNKMRDVLSGSLNSKDLLQAYQDIINQLKEMFGDHLVEGDDGYELYVYWTTQYKKAEDQRNAFIDKVFGNVPRSTIEQLYGDWLDTVPDKFMADFDVNLTGLNTAEEKIEFINNLIENIPNKKEIEVEIRTSEDAVNSLADFESAVNSLSDLWWQTVEKNPNASEEDLLGWGYADPAKINSVEQAFSKLIQTLEDDDAKERLGASLRDLEDTLVKFPNDSEKAKVSINNLINAYLNETDILKDLTEENQEYYVARLKLLKIENAEEVVQSRLTAETKNTTAAVKALRDSYNEYYQVLKNGNLNDLDDQDAVANIVKQVQDAITYYDEAGNPLETVFQIDENFVNEHWDTVQRMMQGDKDALRELQQYVARLQFTTSLSVTLPEEAVNAKFNQIWNLIEETNLMDIEVGADLDITNFINKLNELVGDSWEAASMIQSYFKNAFNIDLEMNRNYEQTGASGAPTEALKYMNKNQGIFKGGKKNAGSDLGEKPNYEPPASSSGGGGGSAADKGKSDAEAYTEAYNKELEALKWLKDQNYLTEAEYLEKFRELYQRYYGDLSKYAKEYYEAEKEYYEQKIALQQKAINAVIRLLDRQIKEQEKLRDAEKKEYEEQKKNNEKKIKELEKIIKKYDKQIKQLQKEQKLIRKQNIEPLEEQIKSRQKVIDSLNEEIELMERANEARQDEINLQKAQYELERARHQRTQLVYTEDTGFGQMRYRANPDSVKDAQEAYDNAVYEHRLKIKRDEVQAIQDEIDKYQKEIDKYNEQIELIDKKIEKLEDEKEIVQEKIEKYQEENEKLDEIIEKIDERYQKEIDRIEEYKQKWQELLEIQEQIEDLEVLSSLDLDISSLINLDPSVFENFKDKYTETLSHLYDANQHYADAFNDALSQGLAINTDKMHGLEDAAKQMREVLSDVDGTGSGGGGGGGGGLSLSKTPEVLDEAGDKAEEAGDKAEDAVDDTNEALKNTFDNTDQKLSVMEKRIQTDFARNQKAFTDWEDVIKKINEFLGKSSESMSKMAEDADKITISLGKAKDAAGWLKSLNGHSDGTVGNAFASGTGYPGLKHSEVALRSEYGQPELTVYPNGKYELTTEPTMSKLPKDTVIFNEEQTKRILDNGKKGNSFAEGTGLKSLEEVMPDKAELFSKFEANLSNNMSTIQSSLDIISRNTAEINSNLASKITNNNVGMSYVNNGDINITCPGVTSQEVLDSITEQLNSTFFGMANNSYQRAMKRG